MVMYPPPGGGPKRKPPPDGRRPARPWAYAALIACVLVALPLTIAVMHLAGWAAVAGAAIFTLILSCLAVGLMDSTAGEKKP